MKKRDSSRRYIWLQVKFFLVIALGYLLQVCVMPYVSIGGVTPSLIYAVIAILTVGYGRLRALWADFTASSWKPCSLPCR